ncbi:MAG: type VI secretion system VgrG family protein [Paraglaciecola sp.]|jgi:type VI secretion system VgrG family protein
MAAEQRVYVNFQSTEFDDIAPSLFQVVGFDGTEAISQLFRFEVDLISCEPDIDTASLIGKAASLEISRDDTVRNVHGIISHLQQGEEVAFQKYAYKAVLVPRLWLMSLSRQNQIYQEKSVAEIVSEEILQGEFAGGMVSTELQLRLAATYPAKEYTVQYKETDLSFISRLMEHEGIYYYFDHTKASEHLILCDHNPKLDAVLADNTVSYVPPSGLASAQGQAIHGFVAKQAQISKEIVLKDYNYRTPQVPLVGDSQTNDQGYGRLCSYGDHFKDMAQGENLATVRAQAELCKQTHCSGSSDALLFSAGKLMHMLDHYRDSLNGEYLITHIRHRGGQALPGTSGLASSGEAIAYQNDFEAIPAEVQFRPAVTLEKPKLYGFMSAIVDGAISSDRAQIDEHGRYKLLMPFDVSGSGDGKASRWVRKAEPFGGQGTGMNFPLLKGAEVIWCCMDGDLDRPIITGVVPGTGEGLNKSMVTAQNSTDNVIKTPSGIVVQMRDGKGAPPQEEQEGTEQSQTRIQPEAQANDTAGTKTSSHYMSSKDTFVSLIQQQQYTNTGLSNYDPIDLGTVDETYTHNCTSNFSGATDFRLSGTDILGVGIDPAGVLTWKQANGNHIVNITYTDSADVLLQEGFYKIKGVIHFSSTPPSGEIETGASFSYQAKVVNSTTITYALTNNTSGMEVSTKGYVTWTAGATGPHTATLTATEESSSTVVSQLISINVTEDVKFVERRDVQDDAATAGVDETQKSYAITLPHYRTGAGGVPLYSYSRLGAFHLDELSMKLGGNPETKNLYYSTDTFDSATGLPWSSSELETNTLASPKVALTKTFIDASKGGHKIMDVLNATRETYDIPNSTSWAAGLYESLDPHRFGLMEYTDGAKLMVHWNGCFDLAAGTSVTYDSLGPQDSLISVVLGENEMIKSERFHKPVDSETDESDDNLLGKAEDGYNAAKDYLNKQGYTQPNPWVTETWEKVNAFNYNNGQVENIFYGQTYDYFFGKKVEAFTGYATECSLGGKASFQAGISSEVKLGAEFNFGGAWGFNYMMGGAVDLCEGSKSIGGKGITIQYEDNSVLGHVYGVASMAAAATAVGLITKSAIAANPTAGINENVGDVKGVADNLRPLADGAEVAGMTINALSAAALLTYKVAQAGKWAGFKASKTAVAPLIKVEKDSITLAAGAASIVLKSTGEIEIKGLSINLEAAKGAATLDLTGKGLNVVQGTSGIICETGGTTIYKGANAVGVGPGGHAISGPKIDFS